MNELIKTKKVKIFDSYGKVINPKETILVPHEQDIDKIRNIKPFLGTLRQYLGVVNFDKIKDEKPLILIYEKEKARGFLGREVSQWRKSPHNPFSIEKVIYNTELNNIKLICSIWSGKRFLEQELDLNKIVGVCFYGKMDENTSRPQYLFTRTNMGTMPNSDLIYQLVQK